MSICKSLAITVLVSLSAHAEGPNAAQAEKLVKGAVAYAQKNGMDKLIFQTNQANGIFHVGSGSQLYIFIYDPKGLCKAIGYNTMELVGKNRIDLKDPDGKMIIREFINTATTKGKGWVDYKYPNPITGKVEQKTSYLEFHDGLIVGSGVYK